MQDESLKEEKKWLSLYKSTSEDRKERKPAREILKAKQKETNDVRIFLRNLGLKRKSERGTYRESARTQ